MEIKNDISSLFDIQNILRMNNSRERIKDHEKKIYHRVLSSVWRGLSTELAPWSNKAFIGVLFDLKEDSRLMTNGELYEGITKIIDSLPRSYPKRIASTDNYEGSLERRLGELEAELEGLRSNPALEKKIAKLEEKLEKLKLDSVAITEDSEKEQENMLKQYKAAKKRVFVIMPFAPVFDDVWHGGIRKACNSEDMGCLRVDKISLSSWITEDIKSYLDTADFVIADTTGNNPNVMFEFGWALALKKKPIVIRQKDDPNTLPFDVKDIRHISYQNNWSGVENLRVEICKFLRTTSETSEEKSTEEKKEKKKKS